MNTGEGIHLAPITCDQRTCGVVRTVEVYRDGVVSYKAQRCGGLMVYAGMTQDSPYYPMYRCEQCGVIKEE
jgi:hypothetical protein